MPMSMRVCFATLLLFAASAPLFAEAPLVLTHPQLVSFEHPEPAFRVEEGRARLQLVRYRAMDGENSLRWSWDAPGSAIRCDVPINYQRRPDRIAGQLSMSAFGVWVYCESPVEGALRFEFGREGQAGCWFDFNLDFTGWRTAWVGFNRDMEGRPDEGMDFLRVRAPEGVPQGAVYLDGIVLSNPMDRRFAMADWQVPFVNRGAGMLARNTELAETPLPPEAEAAGRSPEANAAIAEIERRFQESILGVQDPLTPGGLARLEERFAFWRIAEEEGRIRGRRVWYSFQRNIYPRELHGEINEWFRRGTFRDYTGLMLELARAWHAAPDGETAERVAEMYLAMTRHLLDQGWAEGSALGTVRLLGYQARSWGPAVFLMREVLAEAGLLEAKARALQWYFQARRVVEPVPPERVNLDYFNIESYAHAIALLTLPDGPEKTGLLALFSQWLSEQIAVETPGTTGGFKPDGTAFHHSGHYPGYSFGALSTLGRLFRLMSGTPFALSDEARANYKRALMASRLFCNPQMTIATCGRHPFTGRSIQGMRFAYANFASSGGEGGEPFDREVAAALLRFSPEYMARRMELFGTEDIEPEPWPEGFWTLNYANMGVHWHDRTMVTLKGYSRYVWASEIYHRDNRYGRYQSNGSVLVMYPGGNAASGFAQDGWDWNRLPGTTAPHLPLDLLESPRVGTEMRYSTQTFAGSAHLDNRAGVFGVILEQPDRERYDPEFKARKSVFALGDMLVCLGSGIRAGDEEHNVETTLFQNALPMPDAPVFLNRPAPIAEFPYAADFGEEGGWLVDAVGTGYVLPPGQRAHLRRGWQHSRHNKTKEPTEGDFAVAWIDHGPAPQGASYHYAILLNADADKAADFHARMNRPGEEPYSVLQHDDRAHVVRSGDATGYVCFEAGPLEAEGLVRYVSRPAFVIVRQGDGGIRISVTDPDLNIPIPERRRYLLTDPAVPTIVEVEFAGNWALADGTPAPIETVPPVLSAGNTRLRVTCHHGIPVNLGLRDGGI